LRWPIRDALVLGQQAEQEEKSERSDGFLPLRRVSSEWSAVGVHSSSSFGWLVVAQVRGEAALKIA